MAFINAGPNGLVQPLNTETQAKESNQCNQLLEWLDLEERGTDGQTDRQTDEG